MSLFWSWFPISANDIKLTEVIAGIWVHDDIAVKRSEQNKNTCGQTIKQAINKPQDRHIYSQEKTKSFHIMTVNAPLCRVMKLFPVRSTSHTLIFRHVSWTLIQQNGENSSFSTSQGVTSSCNRREPLRICFVFCLHCAEVTASFVAALWDVSHFIVWCKLFPVRWEASNYICWLWWTFLTVFRRSLV